MKHSKLRAPFSGEEVENNWAISYGDMITLLLGFFVIFFNIKNETMNLNLIKKDLDQYFDSPQGQSQQRDPALAESLGDQQTVPVLTSDISNALQIKSNLEGERILVEFPGVSFFQSASHRLTPSGQEALQNFSQAISSHLGLFRLVVRGYTDGQPVKGTSRYKDNLELSAFRSLSAIRFLSKQGIRLEHMRVAGFGESSKSRVDKAKEDYEQQRKVVIVIEPLDHTERPPLQEKGEAPQKPIEEVSAVHIQGREPASVVKAMTLKDHLAQIYSQVPQWSEVQYQVDDTLIRWDLSIEQHPLYQRFLDYLVRRELKDKGYSEKQITQMMQDYENQRRKP
jgi:chemotaxis protein MotB